MTKFRPLFTSIALVASVTAASADGVDFNRMKNECARLNTAVDCLHLLQAIEDGRKQLSLGNTFAKGELDRAVEKFLARYRPVAQVALRD